MKFTRPKPYYYWLNWPEALRYRFFFADVRFLIARFCGCLRLRSFHIALGTFKYCRMKMKPVDYFVGGWERRALFLFNEVLMRCFASCLINGTYRVVSKGRAG